MLLSVGEVDSKHIFSRSQHAAQAGAQEPSFLGEFDHD